MSIMLRAGKRARGSEYESMIRNTRHRSLPEQTLLIPRLKANFAAFYDSLVNYSVGPFLACFKAEKGAKDASRNSQSIQDNEMRLLLGEIDDEPVAGCQGMSDSLADWPLRRV